jgi:capsular polysaccharide transport system permease protein
MTTPLKAKKYRIRRAAPVMSAPPEPQAHGLTSMPATEPQNGPSILMGNDTSKLFESNEDGFGALGIGAPSTTSKGTGYTLAQDGANVLGPHEVSADEEIAKIRAEGLTGRQLRMARRVSQRQGMETTSDFDAVRQLRRAGIDPFDRGTIASMISMSDTDGDTVNLPQTTGVNRALARMDGKGADPRVQLPQTMSPGQNLPSTNVNSNDHRASEIMRIQRDIARRRRRKIVLLATRLSFFVFLPTLIAAYYFYVMATPLYATKTEFVIQQADNAGTGLGGLFSGTQLATSQDSIAVQSYLQSREALLRLSDDKGYKEHFSQEWIDPMQRLEPGASNEAVYRLYKGNTKIGYDPSEGIIKMEVVAADPQSSVEFSKALISYAEEQVDQLTQRLREDQMQGARESYADAEEKVLNAQQKVLELQEQMGVLDPVTETQAIMSQINTFEVQLQAKRLGLQQLLDNARPNQARVDGTRGDIARLEALIADLRSGLTQGVGGNSSLASVTGQLRIAEAELQTRQLMLSQAAQQLETARIEANKQVRYLSMGVRPVGPDEPTYPRSFENTLLAFLIFSGIYLMLSLTASILREQVSA